MLAPVRKHVIEFLNYEFFFTYLVIISLFKAYMTKILFLEFGLEILQ